MSITAYIEATGIPIDCNAPVIDSLSPTADSIIYSLLPEFIVEVTDQNSCECKFELFNDVDEAIVSWNYIAMTDNGDGTHSYSYKMLESDDYLAFGSFKIKVTVRDDLGNSSTQTNTFTITTDTIDFEPVSLTRNFEGSSFATLQFKLKDNTESRVDLRFFLQLLARANHCKLVEIQTFDGATGKIVGDNSIKGIKSTTSDVTYNVKFKYNTSTELQAVTNELKKTVIEVGNKIEITKYDGDTAFDISSKVSNVSFDRNVDLGAKQLGARLMLDSITNPFGTDPYTMYGNEIVLKQLMKVAGTLEEYTRFTGKISDINVSKNYVDIVGYDDFKLFQDSIDEDLTYTPTKVAISGEQLRTFDGIKFASNYVNWAQYPCPQIYLGNTKLESGEYQIDYYRGIVYIYKNVFLYGDWKERDLDVDNVVDRKNFELDYTIDSNSSLKVYHKWQEKELYTCVEGVESEHVWIDKQELYTESTDYIVDYTNNKVILTTAIPANTDTIRNHYIYIVSRAVEDISANYSYMKEGTNEAEDIIRDIAEKVGFPTSKLFKTITDEVIYSRDGTYYYTEKNNIKAITYLKVNGDNYSDYTIDDAGEKKGKLKIDYPGLAPADILIDPLESTNNITISAESGDTVELDSDCQYGDKSVKCNFGGAGYVEKSYDYTYFRKDLENYNRFALYLKAVNLESEFVATVTLRDNDGHSQGFNFSLDDGDWTQCVCDISGLSWRNDICFVKIAVTEECTLYVDYFHIPEDIVTIKYSYYTLQITDTTINDVDFLREEVDKAVDILEDVLKQVDPSYLVYVDEEGYLCGEHKKVRWSLLESQVYKSTGFDYMVLAGKFLLEDYRLQLVSDPQSSISDESIYTSVLICGKLADRRNVALEAIDTTNDSSWHDEAFSYTKLGTARIQDKNVPFTTTSRILIKLREDQEGTSFTFDSTALNDNSVDTGIHWYMKTQDATNRPAPDSLMITMTLKEAIHWEEIAICIGSYKNKVIRQETYIKVVDSEGQEWYPEGEIANKKQGNTGTWLIFKNSYNKNIKIKKVKVYLSEPWSWVTSESVQNSKK